MKVLDDLKYLKEIIKDENIGESFANLRLLNDNVECYIAGYGDFLPKDLSSSMPDIEVDKLNVARLQTWISNAKIRSGKDIKNASDKPDKPTGNISNTSYLLVQIESAEGNVFYIDNLIQNEVKAAEVDAWTTAYLGRRYKTKNLTKDFVSTEEGDSGGPLFCKKKGETHGL